MMKAKKIHLNAKNKIPTTLSFLYIMDLRQSRVLIVDITYKPFEIMKTICRSPKRIIGLISTFIKIRVLFQTLYELKKLVIRNI